MVQTLKEKKKSEKLSPVERQKFVSGDGSTADTLERQVRIRFFREKNPQPNRKDPLREKYSHNIGIGEWFIQNLSEQHLQPATRTMPKIYRKPNLNQPTTKKTLHF